MSIPTLNRQRGSSMACATATWPVYLKDGYAWSAMTSPDTDDANIVNSVRQSSAGGSARQTH